MVSLARVLTSILLNILVRNHVFMLGLGWLVVFAGTEGWRALLRFRVSDLETRGLVCIEWVLGL